MIFVTNGVSTDKIEINTMSELKAYALGGDGKITIDFLNREYFTGSITHPVITKGGANED